MHISFLTSVVIVNLKKKKAEIKYIKIRWKTKWKLEMLPWQLTEISLSTKITKTNTKYIKAILYDV